MADNQTASLFDRLLDRLAVPRQQRPQINLHNSARSVTRCCAETQTHQLARNAVLFLHFGNRLLANELNHKQSSVRAYSFEDSHLRAPADDCDVCALAHNLRLACTHKQFVSEGKASATKRGKHLSANQAAS